MAEVAPANAPQSAPVATMSSSENHNDNAGPSPNSTAMDVDTATEAKPAHAPVLGLVPTPPIEALSPLTEPSSTPVPPAADPSPDVPAPEPAFSLVAALAAAAAAASAATAPDSTTSSDTAQAPEDAPPQPSPPKRSRSPESEVDNGAEKRQKTEHHAEQEVEPKVENSEDNTDAAGWDLEAMLSNALGSFVVVPAKDPSLPPEAPTGDESTKTEVVEPAPPMLLPPPLPPPPIRKREPEKMKFIENPTYFVRAMGLPLLGSLAVQILLALFQQPSEVTDKHIRDQRTEGGKVYLALRATFMAALKLFAESTHFLSADDLDIQNPGDRETIQMANLANMCASFYGPGGPTMATAHDYFLRIMVPVYGMITEDISMLYLDQKTQSFLAYANVMDDKEATRASLMDKFFPTDLEDKLKAHHRDSNLIISAEEFVRPHTDRRNLLRAIGHDKDKRKALEAKYPFSAFLDSLSAFIRSNFAAITEFAESHGFDIPLLEGENDDYMLADAMPNGAYPMTVPGQQRRTNGQANGDNSYEAQGLASLIAEKLNGGYGSSQQMYNGQYSGQYANQQQYYQYPQGTQAPSGMAGDSTNLPPTQSLPTATLYEQARQAAITKSSSHARREGLHSTRRPWTPEEEKALMAGLDMVKGPHWSQILQLFGQHGSISDILKDRTQVQLKDKARNLKLFFLKTNSEMPYYLQCVTGELKTRAPSQAARKEAEERARMNSEEDQARTMTLAGGLQNNPAYNTSNGSANNTAATLAHGLPVAGSMRASPATPGVGGTGHATNTHLQQLMPGQVKSEPSTATSIAQAHQVIAPAPAPAQYQHPAPQPQQQSTAISPAPVPAASSVPSPAPAHVHPAPAAGPVKQEQIPADTSVKAEEGASNDDEYLKSALTAAINGAN